MNTLSWFLYFADVVQGIGMLLATLGVLLPVAGTLIFTYPYEKEEQTLKPMRFAFIALCAGVLLLMLSALVPSKSTMYAIAASELGESALKSEIGVKAQKAVELWINSQIGDKK